MYSNLLPYENTGYVLECKSKIWTFTKFHVSIWHNRMKKVETMRIAIGMDLYKKSAVCYATYAGEGKVNEKNAEF